MPRAALRLAPLLLHACAAAALVLSAGCSDDVDVQAGQGGAASTSTEATTTTTDTSTTTSTGESCDVGFSAGCCFGDGVCCPCAAHGCDYASTHESQIALTDCLCQDDVCGPECQFACVGQGIDLSCFVCAAREAEGACQSDYDACGGPPSSCGTPGQTCRDCVGCAQVGSCYDAWHACWFDAECQAVMICSGDGSLAALQGCLPEHPGAAGLLDAYAACAFCDTCNVECQAETRSYCVTN